MTVKPILNLIQATVQGYSRDKGSMLAASLTYYTIFSMAPLLVLAVAIASLAVGDQAVEGELVVQIQGVVGQEAAVLIENVIENASESTSGITATVISTVLLLLGASGVFNQLKTALNIIWGIAPPPKQSLVMILKTRFLSFAMVLGVGLLLLLSFVISTVLGIVSNWLAETTPLLANVLPILDILVSLTLLVGIFALIFKTLPDATVAWSDVGLGALVTAVLMTIGKYLISFYLSSWSGGAAYGAASSLILLLFWIYLSAQIFLFGAEFTQIFANRYGSKLIPYAGAQVIVRQPYEAPQVTLSPMTFPEEGETADSPHRQRQKQLATGLMGLALGLLLGFLGNLTRRAD